MPNYIAVMQMVAYKKLRSCSILPVLKGRQSVGREHSLWKVIQIFIGALELYKVNVLISVEERFNSGIFLLKSLLASTVGEHVNAN